MTVSAIEVAYRVTCEQVEYAGSVSSKWVNGFLYVVASEYAKEKNQAPFPEDFHTYTTGPVVPATRVFFQGGVVTRKQARLMKRAIPEPDASGDDLLESIYQRVFENLKMLSGDLVMRRVCADGSAWWVTNELEGPIIPWKLIKRDVSYKELLGARKGEEE